MDRATVVSRIAHQSLYTAPNLLTGSPWWMHLDEAFSQMSEDFDLALSDRMMVKSCAYFDTILRTFAATGVASTSIPRGFHPFRLPSMLREGLYYQKLADQGDPEKVFVEPPKNVKITATKRRFWTNFRPKDGVCEDLHFESPFTPIHPEMDKRYLRHKANRIAHARYWRHNDGPRPTIVAIHGFGADQYWLNAWFFTLKWYYERGCDVLLFTLPFHGRRQTQFSPFSGYGYFAGGTSGVNEAVAQSVMDFRIFFNYLEEKYGVEKLGVTGISLGGFTTSILTTIEKRLYFAIPNVPVVSLVDLILEWFPISSIARSIIKRTGYSIQSLRHMIAATTPLTYDPVIPKDRLMIIGGVGDRLAPPKHSRILWEHWGRCRIHWFPGSHILHLDKGAYLKQMSKFMDSLDFFPAQ